MKCNAGWYELNISAPDNQVSACCYYHGPKDQWSDEYRDLYDYWNSADFRLLRRANIEETPDSGCSGCHYFRHSSSKAQYFSGLPNIDPTASPLQQENWRLAYQEFEANRELLTAKPLRYYVNFGFACNLSCIQCHQVPRRQTIGRQVSSEVLYKWREHFKSALDVGVIGGEPFALVEALKFIRAFVDDDELKDVRLTIYTNGTLHDRHMATLAKKRKLSLAVSLDSMGEAYEHIRVDGKWEQVEKNILSFIETGKRLGLDWQISTTCGLMKTGIPKLPQFAEWSCRNRIPTLFFELISAPGVEKAVAEENVLANPLLVQQIPGWKDCFTEAALIFRRHGEVYSAASLEYFRDFIESKLARVEPVQKRVQTAAGASNWTRFFDQGTRQLAKLHPCLYGSTRQSAQRLWIRLINRFLRFRISPLMPLGMPLSQQRKGWFGRGYLVFEPTHLHDHLVTDFADLPSAAGSLAVRMTWWWPQNGGEGKRCLVNFQDQDCNSQWDVDFEQAVDAHSFQRHMVLKEDCKRFRLVLSASGTQPVVLPARVRLEFRPAQELSVTHEHSGLVQIQTNA